SSRSRHTRCYRDWSSDVCSSDLPMGARQLRRTLTQPLLDLSRLEERFESVEELYESPALRSRFTMCLQSLGDMERIAGRVRQGKIGRASCRERGESWLVTHGG